jgi:HK97 family phage portal protein
VETIAVTVDDDINSRFESAYEIALAHCDEARVARERREREAEKSSPALMRILANQFPMQPDSFQFIYQQRLNIWVYRCVSVVVGAAKRPEPRLFREWISKGTLKSEQLPHNHKAVQLLESPNARDSWPDIVEKYVTSRELTGIYYLAFDEQANTLDHLRSDRIEIVPDKDGKRFISGYRYTVDGRTMGFLPGEIVSGRYWNPDDDFYGLPPLMAARNSIAAHARASRWNISFFDNAAVLTGYLKSGYNFSNDKEFLDNTRAEWAKLYQGYQRAGAFAVLGGDLDWKPLSPTHTEMGFIGLLGRAQQEIFSAFGVPNIYGNITEGMNYANSREQQGLFWQTKMIPNFKSDEGTFEKFFNAHFAGPDERLRVRHDLTGIEALSEGVVAEAEASRVYVTSFQRTPNQARARRGEAPEEGGDSLIGPSSFCRIDQVGDIIGGIAPGGLAPAKTAGSHRAKSIMPDVEARRAHWEGTKAIVVSAQEKMQRLIVVIAGDWRRQMLEQLGSERSAKALAAKALSADEIVFDLDEATGMLKLASRPIFEDTARRGGERAFSIASGSGSFNLHDPRVDAKLQAAEQRFVNRIGNANWQRVRDSLQEGINLGESSRALSDRINAEMDRIDSSAATIARTEVLPRYHEGQIEGMRQSGVVDQKEWLSAFVEASRAEHMAANSQVVALDEPFIVGSEPLQYPGDPSGSPSNIINCLCDVLPVVASAEE